MKWDVVRHNPDCCDFLCTVYQSLTKWHSNNPGAQIQIEREFYEMFSWVVTYNSTHYLMRWSCRNSSGYKGSDNVIRIIDTEQPRSKWINSRVLNWLWLPTSVHLIRYQLYPITINQNKLSADWDEKKRFIFSFEIDLLWLIKYSIVFGKMEWRVRNNLEV